MWLVIWIWFRELKNKIVCHITCCFCGCHGDVWSCSSKLKKVPLSISKVPYMFTLLLPPASAACVLLWLHWEQWRQWRQDTFSSLLTRFAWGFNRPYHACKWLHHQKIHCFSEAFSEVLDRHDLMNTLFSIFHDRCAHTHTHSCTLFAANSKKASHSDNAQTWSGLCNQHKICVSHSDIFPPSHHLTWSNISLIKNLAAWEDWFYSASWPILAQQEGHKNWMPAWFL